MDRAGRAAILAYRCWLSHRWPGKCGYTPTCSAYGLAALERYGLAVGGRMGADRLRRCRPGVPRGTHDPLRWPRLPRTVRRLSNLTCALRISIRVISII
ncbi:membrane protein insertion efficiency factor YidD [Micromonospora sicca]|uniref:membrane protein insertion efficiency factor YidD n=1 Tax=Micromonospora sicca TaxID=2202420 RepID=UPI001F39578A|nr:membrane protein insertion efficiency factor YidD [Micromonospora sp. 4G51]